MIELRSLGDYELDGVIGEGAFGTVYRGRTPDSGVVAVKTLRSELAADDAFRRRFAREARIARDLRDRHLVAVLDAGEANGVVFLVLEYVAGGSLEARLAQGPLPEREAVSVVVDVAAGLEALHRRGVVHRDVKPSNILFREDRTAALTDFGLAREVGATVLTRAGRALGTLDYTAPELLRGEEATPASDVYALGCVAYACLAGTPPFADRSLFGIGAAHLEEEPPEPPAPPQLAWAVVRALAKDPAERPATATMYARMLRIASRSRDRRR